MNMRKFTITLILVAGALFSSGSNLLAAGGDVVHATNVVVVLEVVLDHSA